MQRREPDDQRREPSDPLQLIASPQEGGSTRDRYEQDRITDLHLVRRMKSGDADALADLYDRYAATVNGLARSILRDARLAEEATHDVFLNLWQNPDGYDAARGPFAGWLFRVARNRAIDLFRRRREQPFTTTADSESGDTFDPASFLVDPEPDPADQAVSTLQRESVRRGMTELTADHRRLLELAYFRGMTQSEIAAYLNRPLGTVKTQIRSAMRKLAEILGEISTEPGFSNVSQHRGVQSPESTGQVHLIDDVPGASSRL